MPPDTDAEAHWQRANAEGVPRFFALARDAGIRRAVLVGSFYPQAMPGLVVPGLAAHAAHAAMMHSAAAAAGSHDH